MPVTHSGSSTSGMPSSFVSRVAAIGQITFDLTSYFAPSSDSTLLRPTRPIFAAA